MDEKRALFQDMDAHICRDERPSQYMEALDFGSAPASMRPFNILSGLKKVGQSPIHHPEGNVWNHTMLVLDEAAKRRGRAGDSRVFMWAALLHDVGKAVATRYRKGKITAYDHDKEGAVLAREFLKEFEPESVCSKVAALVRWHMQILYVTKSERFSELEAMRREVDVHDIALLGLCDRLGRTGADRRAEERVILDFLRKADGNE